MKKKIVLLPLDERPCNLDFPTQLFSGDDIEFVCPDRGILGDKKRPANAAAVQAFLERECRNAYGAIISTDMLLYDGLLPSRLHHMTEAETDARLTFLDRLRGKYPKLVLYAFSLIMRCPSYSSDDEEPDYYGICGREIHISGSIVHRHRLGLISEVQRKEELRALYPVLDDGALSDYLDRRAFNLKNNVKILDKVKSGAIDFLIIPQDDAAKYGYTAMDQEIVRSRIAELHLQLKALMYPGADEVALTLGARMLSSLYGRTPSVYLKYAATTAPMLIPAYEDRPLGETLKYHIEAVGCRMAYSPETADIIFAVSAGGSEGMGEAVCQHIKTPQYSTERNIAEFVAEIARFVADGKIVTLGDNAYANGADLELIDMLAEAGLLFRLGGYAGWNTSSNTLGTALAAGVDCCLRGDRKERLDFLAERYVEDAGYCACVRSDVTENCLKELGMSPVWVHEMRGVVSRIVAEKLREFVRQKLADDGKKIVIEDVFMPWSRMFEVGLKVRYEDKK